MLFKDVIGNKKEKQHLVSTVKRNKISHAQLFLEKEGAGALALALAYSQFINCENRQENDSCGKCPSCIKNEKLVHPDVQFVFPNATTSNIGSSPKSSLFLNEWRNLVLKTPYFNLNDWFLHLNIENKQGIINQKDSQDILNNLSRKAYEGKYKVVIIWMAEKMNSSFANKILKILEEPPEKTLFLMICENTEFILPTIISRVQTVHIKSPSEEEIAEYLTQKGIEENIAQLAARNSENNVRKALILSESNETNELQTLFQSWMRLCYKADLPALVHWVEKIAKIGREQQKQLLKSALITFRKCVINAYSPELNTYINEEEKKFITNFSPFVNEVNIVTITALFNKAILHIERNGNPKPIFLDLSLKTTKLIKIKRKAVS